MVLGTGRRPLAVFLGVALAFVIQSLVAVSWWSLFSLCPPLVVRITSGVLLFLAFAVAMWLALRARGRRRGPADVVQAFLAHRLRRLPGHLHRRVGRPHPAFATAALAAKHQAPFTIFLAATCALWLVSALAIALGNRMRAVLPVPLIQRLAAVLFLAIGVVILCGAHLGGGSDHWTCDLFDSRGAREDDEISIDHRATASLREGGWWWLMVSSVSGHSWKQSGFPVA